MFRPVLIVIFLLFITGCKTTSNNIELHLSEIKNNTPKLINFFDKFPKGADLHNHVSGATYVEFGLLHARENPNYYFDTEALQIILSNSKAAAFSYQDYFDDELKPAPHCEGKTRGRRCLVSINSLLTKRSLHSFLKQYLDIVSIRGWHAETANGQDHFFNAFNHLYIPGRNSQIFAEVIARNHSQGVHYLELMTSIISPKYTKWIQSKIPPNYYDINRIDQAYSLLNKLVPNESFITMINQSIINRENAIEKVLKEKYGLTIKGDTPDVVVRYIPQLYRNQTNSTLFLNAFLNFKASKVNDRIVATNMVTNEAAIESLANFDEQMKIFEFLWHKLDKPNITLHAGELTLKESPLEPMRSRISDSINIGKASRIGHGISIAWEDDTQATLSLMKQHNIVLEACLSSNEIILGVTRNDHPIRLYLEAGVPITIATDDEAVTRSNLTMEYVKAFKDFNLSYRELKQIAKNGLKYSFLSGKGIYDDLGQVLPKYYQVINAQTPTISELGVKAYLQVNHEIALKAFEASLL